MKRLVILLALLAPVQASACPNLLIGDSLAVGMAAYARADGFQVIARQGAGLSWLRAQAPRCVGILVVMIGTNDLPGMSRAWAQAYPARVAEVVTWWRPERSIWATPACFPARPAMERASAWLDAAVEPTGSLGRHRGRPARCSPIGGDGIHPSAQGYRSWWRDLRPP
ncbi:MAG: GDSL-like Lipase/Acylhydrolase family [Rubritepida sp.]|nr:GDSL-like Lipase/Acylhydrolase family [Rubritepida sp.]